MPIAPIFEIEQTPTHVCLDIHVPHIRVTRDSLQVELSNDETVLHFASLPIYGLRLDFSPHRFQPYDDPSDDHSDNSDCEEDYQQQQQQQDQSRLFESPSTRPASLPLRRSPNKLLFLPMLRNGTVRLELAKLVPGVYWSNLDWIGRLMMTPSSSTTSLPPWSSSHGTETSVWLHQVTDTSDHAQPSDNNETVTSCLVTPPTTAATPKATPTATTPLILHEDGGLYGFGRLFRGIFTDLHRDGVAKQMLEGPWTCDDDDNTLLFRLRSQDRATDTVDDDASVTPIGIPLDASRQQKRRVSRWRYENQVFDSDRYLADLLLDDSIPPFSPLGETSTNDKTLDDDDNDSGGEQPWEQDEYDDAGDASYARVFQMQPHWVVDDDDDDDDLTLSVTFSERERLALMSIPYPHESTLSSIPFFHDDSTTSTTTQEWGVCHRNSNNNDRRNNTTAVTPTMHDRLCVGLLDILFAYVYDHLLNDGEANVESAWTISTLSASLSWLDDWLDDNNSVDDDDDDSAIDTDTTSYAQTLHQLTRRVVVSSTRRALIYPYIRTVTLARHVWRQVALLLRTTSTGIPHYGEPTDTVNVRTVLRCLLHIRDILQCSDLHYLGNKLFIDPYLAWLQQRQQRPSSDEPTTRESSPLLSGQTNTLEALADAIDLIVGTNEMSDRESLKSFKDSLGLDLVQLEAEFFGESNGNDEDTQESSESESDDVEDDQRQPNAVQCDLHSAQLDHMPAIHEIPPREMDTTNDINASQVLLDMHVGVGRSPLNVIGTLTGDVDKTVAAMESLSLINAAEADCGNQANGRPLIQEMD